MMALLKNSAIFVFSLMILIGGVSNTLLNAQTKSGVISGSVIDKSTGVPIEGADVTLHRIKDSSLVKGTSTSIDGSFSLNEIPNGNYFLRSNLVGYNFAVVSGLSVTGDNQNISLQPLKLTTGTTTTEEIVVESEKSFIEFKPDKKVFNVSRNLISQGGMLIDLLKEIPSVNVDQDGNVSLRGGEGVRILIDGRPFGLEGQGRTAILEQTPASDVESVELITNPSAKYEAEGSTGIINIVMKKNLQQGLGYTGNLGLNLGTGDKYSGQFSLSLRNQKLNLFGNYSYNKRNMTSTGFSNRIYFGNSLLSSIEENSTGRMRGNSHNVKLGLDYFINKQNTLGLSVNYRNGKRTRTGLGEYTEYDVSNNPITDFFSYSLDDDKGNSLDANLNYTLKFKKPQQELTADLSFSRDIDEDFSNTSSNYINPVNSTPPQRNEYENEKDYSFSGKLDYVHPFTKDTRLDAGYKGSYKQREDDYRIENFDYTSNQFVTDYDQSNNFLYKEQIHGLYGIFTSKIKNFGYSLGARVEQTFVKGELLTTGQNFDRNYIDIFPSASISQKITKLTEIQLSYSRRVNRPRMGQLNPFRSTSWGNTNNYSEGNPNLNPEFTDSYELSFIQFLPWATITPSIFYRYTKDEIARTKTLIDSVSTLSTFVNYNSSRSYGGELIINLQPAKIVSLNGTFSYFRREVDATNLQSGLSNKGDSWTARAMSTFKLPADLNLQMSYFYSGKQVSAQGTFEPIQSFDAAVKKDLFNKKLSLTFKVSDLFDQRNFKFSYYDPGFSEISQRLPDSRTFFLNISYNFGQQDKKQDRRKKGNNENEPEDDDGYGF